jgi:hypothetical protein
MQAPTGIMHGRGGLTDVANEDQIQVLSVIPIVCGLSLVWLMVLFLVFIFMSFSTMLLLLCTFLLCICIEDDS